MTFRSTLLRAVALALFIGGCAHAPPEASRAPASSAPAQPSSGTSTAPTPSTPYYKDDGPGSAVPANIDAIPDAVPRREELNRFASRPYTVLGRGYVPATELKPYKERGIASWYGRRFHGQKTSIGETYDMYAMSAAHPTLPLPSYARVTNAATGKSVVVRVNDRGPFLHDRVIDLSYAAAHRIGIAQKGSGEVIVEAVLPGDKGTAAPAPPTMTAAAGTTVQPAAQQSATAGPALTNAPPPPAAGTAFANTPAPAATATDAPASMTVADAGRFVVQLGAFRDYANAQNFLARSRERVAPLAGEPRVSQVKGLWRVYVGPYDNEADARQMGDRLYAALGIDNTVSQH